MELLSEGAHCDIVMREEEEEEEGVHLDPADVKLLQEVLSNLRKDRRVLMSTMSSFIESGEIDIFTLL
jgi:hypothetical protein